MSKPGFTGRFQSGISFVEVLVAMVIGVIILAGVMQSMLTNQRNTVWSDDVAYIQENARYGLEILARDMRGSGYWGCAMNQSIPDDGATVFGNAVDVAIDHPWLRLEGIQGYEGSVDTFPDGLVPAANLWENNANFVGNDDFTPDAVIFRSADPTIDLQVTRHVRTSAVFNFTRDNLLEAGDMAVVVSEDCSHVGLMQASAADADSLTHDTGSVSPGNCTNRLRSTTPFTCDAPPPDWQAFGPGSVVMRYRAVGYYIGTSAADNTQPALFRALFVSMADDDEVTVQTDEIAIGVEDFQVLYGFDTDADGLANAYIRADEIDTGAGEWRQVVSVRFSLLMRGFGDTREGDAEVKYLAYPYAGDDDSYTGQGYTDAVLRQQVSKTVRIRNINAG
jgi:type IV pilus assembly protein PilW